MKRPTVIFLTRLVAFCLTVAAMVAAPAARAQNGDDARKLLKAMSDYVAGQKTITLTYDSDIEVVTAGLQKLQFASSGQLQLSRPDKVRATRTGGYTDVEFVFDGKTFSVVDRDNKAFAQAESSSSIDQLVAKLRDEYFVEAPGADLLVSNVYGALVDNVTDAMHVGQGVIDGLECEHLAFRTADADWQIWIQTGPRPVPRKYVITSKNVTGAPQYTLRIKEWKTDEQMSAAAFAFTPPAGAKKVTFKELSQIDEIPAGTVGANK